MRPPWTPRAVQVTIKPPPRKKHDILPAEMRQHGLRNIHETWNPHTVEYYTDGSAEQQAGGRCGAAFVCTRGRLPDTAPTTGRARVSDGCSSTQTELAAISLALQHALSHHHLSVLIHTDSMAAIHALQTEHADNTQLTRNIHTTAQAMTDTGRTVTLNWVPSHVGISGNEQADTLAGQAAQLPQVGLEVPRSLRQLRGIMRRRVETRRLGVPRAPQADTSASVRWLGEVSAAASTYPPSTQPRTRKCEVVAARIRLGYPYGWQIGIVTQEGNKDCRSCGAENSHKLEHYLRDCVRVSHLRQQCPVPSPSLADLAAHFVNVLPKTLKDCPSFCDTKS